jgi:hypothetical protein
MKKLIYSPDYQEKIIQLRNDLDLKYGQKTREKVLAEIDHRIQLLKTYNYLGISLREKYGFDCDFYHIYVANNFVFYEVEEESINIINMYNEREEYIIKFLGSVNKLHEDSIVNID